ncbi:MAG: hypothetical protein NWP83_05035 [Spirosomaceae bacterium]|nr:hypothetical protein [Spirosomataceae bacterium]
MIDSGVSTSFSKTVFTAFGAGFTGVFVAVAGFRVVVLGTVALLTVALVEATFGVAGLGVAALATDGFAVAVFVAVGFAAVRCLEAGFCATGWLFAEMPFTTSLEFPFVVLLSSIILLQINYEFIIN